MTAAGGTNIALTDDNRLSSSGVWNDSQWPAPLTTPGSGGTGGVSTIVDRPWFQQGVAGTGAGRSVPDVSSLADSLPGLLIRCSVPACSMIGATGGWGLGNGTSAAAPVVSGITLLLTQASEAAGQPRPGFLAPLLYAMAADGHDEAHGLYDVTLGTNDTTGVGVYAAGKGFDLASGLGSMLADRFLTALAAPTAPADGPALEATTDGTTTVAFRAAPVLAAGEALRYGWDFEGDGTVDRVTTTPDVTHAYGTAGARTAQVTVWTSLGRHATFSAAVPDPTTGGGRGGGIAPRFTG